MRVSQRPAGNPFLLGEQAFDRASGRSIRRGRYLRRLRAGAYPLIISIGAGDAEIEAETAARMIAGGFTRFNFECLELSPFLIERGNTRIKERGLECHLSFTETNLAHWRPERKFGAAFANQSLHHIEALEHVFDMIGKGLEPQGSFVAADMIGRAQRSHALAGIACHHQCALDRDPGPLEAESPVGPVRRDIGQPRLFDGWF